MVQLWGKKDKKKEREKKKENKKKQERRKPPKNMNFNQMFRFYMPWMVKLGSNLFIVIMICIFGMVSSYKVEKRFNNNLDEIFPTDIKQPPFSSSQPYNWSGALSIFGSAFAVAHSYFNSVLLKYYKYLQKVNTNSCTTTKPIGHLEKTLVCTSELLAGEKDPYYATTDTSFWIGSLLLPVVYVGAVAVSLIGLFVGMFKIDVSKWVKLVIAIIIIVTGMIFWLPMFVGSFAIMGVFPYQIIRHLLIFYKDHKPKGFQYMINILRGHATGVVVLYTLLNVRITLNMLGPIEAFIMAVAGAIIASGVGSTIKNKAKNIMMNKKQ